MALLGTTLACVTGWARLACLTKLFATAGKSDFQAQQQQQHALTGTEPGPAAGSQPVVPSSYAAHLRSRSADRSSPAAPATITATHTDVQSHGADASASAQHSTDIPSAAPTTAEVQPVSKPTQAEPPEAQAAPSSQGIASGSHDTQAGPATVQQPLAPSSTASEAQQGPPLQGTASELPQSQPAAQVAQQVSQSPGSDTHQASTMQGDATEAQHKDQQAAVLHGTASESRPSFLSMLQSKMEQQRQKRRASQSQSASQSNGSLSDSSLSSVHGASPAQPVSTTAATGPGQAPLCPGAGELADHLTSKLKA